MGPSYTCNPNLSTETLLNNVFTQPFPVDVENFALGNVKLNDYFQIIKNLKFCNSKSNCKSWILTTTTYCTLPVAEKKKVLQALCGFLNGYHRPVDVYLIYIPKSDNVKENVCFSPLEMTFGVPVYPNIGNESTDRIAIGFEDNLYFRILVYAGVPMPQNVSNRVLTFSYSSFCGFGLNTI